MIPVPAGRQEALVREGRLCLYPIPQVAVWEMFVLAAREWPDRITVPFMPSLPKDVIVCGVNHCFERQAFVFLLAHESFPVTPEGNHFDHVPDYHSITWRHVPVENGVAMPEVIGS